MNIKIAFTKNGAIMGDFEEENGYWRVNNPVYVAPQATNLALIPILGFCEESSFKLTRDEIQFGSELFTPAIELRNHYSTQFGSGIQLAI